MDGTANPSREGSMAAHYGSPFVEVPGQRTIVGRVREEFVQRGCRPYAGTLVQAGITQTADVTSTALADEEQLPDLHDHV